MTQKYVRTKDELLKDLAEYQLMDEVKVWMWDGNTWNETAERIVMNGQANLISYLIGSGGLIFDHYAITDQFAECLADGDDLCGWCHNEIENGVTEALGVRMHSKCAKEFEGEWERTEA